MTTLMNTAARDRISLFAVMICLAILVLIGSPCAAGEGEAKSDGREVRAQHERMLSGADLEEVRSLETRLGGFNGRGDYTEALSLASSIVEIRSRVQGVDHWETINARSMLRDLERVASKPPKERAVYVEFVESASRRGNEELDPQELQGFLERARELFGEEHAQTAYAYDRLAQFHTARNEFEKAGEILEKLLALRTRLYGEKHPLIASTYTTYAMNLYFRDDHRGAVACFRRVLALREDIRGKDHLDVAMACEHLAQMCKFVGRYAEAESLFERVLRIRVKLGGEENAAAIQTALRLVESLQLQQKWEKADRVLERVSGICRSVHGEEHASVSKCYELRARGLRARSRHAEAQKLLEDSVRLKLSIDRNHRGLWKTYVELGQALESQAKYAEAQKFLQKARPLAIEQFGGEHRNVASIHAALAAILDRQGLYERARKHHERALEMSIRIWGESHHDVAAAHGNYGLNCQDRGDYASAESHLRRSLAIAEAVGGEVATAANSLAVLMKVLGRHAEAHELHRRALLARIQSTGELHESVAQSYHNMATNLSAQGRHAEARPLFLKALALRVALFGERHHDVALSYTNVASNLVVRGRPREALTLFRKSLELRLELFERKGPEVAKSYHDVAFGLGELARYAEAKEFAQKALALRRSIYGELHPEVQSSYSNLAICSLGLGDTTGARKFSEQSLGLIVNLFGERDYRLAQAYSNAARIHEVAGEFDTAEGLLRKSVEIGTKQLGAAHPLVISCLGSLASNLYRQERPSEALAVLEKVAPLFDRVRRQISQEGFERAQSTVVVSPFPLLAVLRARAGKAAGAWDALERSHGRGVLDEVLAREFRRASGEDQARLRSLTSRIAVLDAALRGDRIPTEGEEARRASIREDFHAAQSDLAQLRAELARKHGDSALTVSSLRQVQAGLGADEALVSWVDIPGPPDTDVAAGEHWAVVVRSSGSPSWIRLSTIGSERSDEGFALPGELGRLLAEAAEHGVSLSAARAAELRKRIARQRLDPLRETLAGRDDLPPVRRLIILPSAALRDVPLGFVFPDFVVSHAPSGSILSWLRQRQVERRRAGGATGFFALADPVTVRSDRESSDAPAPDEGLIVNWVVPGSNAARHGVRTQDILLRYGSRRLRGLEDLTGAISRVAGETVSLELWRSGKSLTLMVEAGRLGVVLDSRSPRDVALQRERGERVLRGLPGNASHERLPGSSAEVDAIKKVLDPTSETVVFSGADASEARLQSLRDSGDLSTYRYLHFATHGVPNRQRAFDSELILSQVDLPDPVDQMLAGKEPIDGKLTAREVLETWELESDMVVLSACETAIGRYAGGEGYLGFAQAFLLAGAQSVVLSLWKVDDRATALLMTRFYENLLGKRAGLEKPLRRAEALREAQHWLRDLSRQEAGKALSSRKLRGLPGPKPGKARGPRPFAHPYYWAAFILVGDPG